MRVDGPAVELDGIVRMKEGSAAIRENDEAIGDTQETKRGRNCGEY